ncbi:MAG: sulfatase-like hydrolase/transferase, partial [Bacteroidales bacterium]|nr:sulfatase-like hydrolase/transferase [Bacteroidales bacterium]
MNTLLPLVGLAGAIAPGPADCAKKDSRPDIIFIMTDQQTLQAMSCMGNPYVKTPAMDSLAGDGVLLQRAYCPFPLSGPCRASLITGLTPFQTGATDNAIRPVQWALDAGIGNRMSQAGYECLYAGKWHAPEINVPQGSGFTKLCDMDDRLIASACEEGIAHRDKSKPLFLVASYLDPHEICEFARDATLPYGSLDPFETSACPPLPANFGQGEHTAEALERERQAAPMWHDTYSYSQDDWRRYVYGYYRLVESVDQRIGELLQVLKKDGLYADSPIIS